MIKSPIVHSKSDVPIVLLAQAPANYKFAIPITLEAHIIAVIQMNNNITGITN